MQLLGTARLPGRTSPSATPQNKGATARCLASGKPCAAPVRLRPRGRVCERPCCAAAGLLLGQLASESVLQAVLFLLLLLAIHPREARRPGRATTPAAQSAWQGRICMHVLRGEQQPQPRSDRACRRARMRCQCASPAACILAGRALPLCSMHHAACMPTGQLSPPPPPPAALVCPRKAMPSPRSCPAGHPRSSPAQPSRLAPQPPAHRHRPLFTGTGRAPRLAPTDNHFCRGGSAAALPAGAALPGARAGRGLAWAGLLAARDAQATTSPLRLRSAHSWPCGALRPLYSWLHTRSPAEGAACQAGCGVGVGGQQQADVCVCMFVRWAARWSSLQVCCVGKGRVQSNAAQAASLEQAKP